mmetsp:Transcript_3010/g.6488  ORF Transcript_3010/g.6488 Transcript_3010/m.6488 type:complete len:101 (+) Transcript_3010:120-422(+)
MRCVFRFGLLDRAFVEKEYMDIKALNPLLPVYIRPANQVEPFVAVRYARGVYQKQSTVDMKPEQVADALKVLIEQAPEVNAKAVEKKLSGGGAVKIAYMV